MKVKLSIKDDSDRRILQNAENTARRVELWPAWKRKAPEDEKTTEARTNNND
ncbi:MAG TPA: hypothetical protein VFK02_07505 [Kofleriaceae bacterium]|nr:hypothetical protein [Kofleriaceae bacterium]